MQLQARSRAPSPIYSQDTRRSGRDTCNDARTSRSKRDLVPRQRREQHQHAHCAQQARPPLLSRTASRACTLTAPGLSVRTVLRVVAVDLLRPRRLAADRAADGLHERCDIRATVDLQHDEQCVTASLPDAPGTAPQPSARRPRQHGDLVASLNRHVPGLVRLCSYRPDPTESHGIVYIATSGSFPLRPHPRQRQLLDCRCSRASPIRTPCGIPDC